MEYWTDKASELEGSTLTMGRKYFWNSVGWKDSRPTSFRRDEDSVLCWLRGPAVEHRSFAVLRLTCS